MVSRIDRIDGLTGSIAVKAPVKVATTTNIILSGAQTIGGVTLTADATPRQRVLVKDQASSIENGIYDVNSGAWTRSPDFDGSRDAVDGTQVIVNEGETPFVKSYSLSATNPVAIGIDPLVFVASTETTLAMEPDSTETDHGVDGNTIKTAVDLIESGHGTILLQHDSGSATTGYTLSTSLSTAADTTLRIEPGAIINIATGVTLTINGPIDAGSHQIFSFTGTGLVVFGDGCPVKEIPSEWFGAVADAEATYGTGWEYTAGTDQSSAINKCITASAYRKVILPQGCVYITNPVKLISNTTLVSPGMQGTKLICNQGAQNAIEVDDSLFEVSQFIVDGLHILDARNYLGTSEASGYGIFANRAVNGVHIKNSIVKGFSDGSIFVGADSNDRAGDNIYIDKTWVSPGSVSNIAIAVGNFNNILSVSNIYCDGDGSVIERVNGNTLSGVWNINGVKHEAGASSTASVITSSTDRVTCNGVFRVCSDVDAPVIAPVSNRGAYFGIQNVPIDLASNNNYTFEFSGGEKFFAADFVTRLYVGEDLYTERALASSSDIPYVNHKGVDVFGSAPVDKANFGAQDIAPLVSYNPSDETKNSAGMIFTSRNQTATVPALKVVSPSGGSLLQVDWNLPQLTFGGISGSSRSPVVLAGSGSPEGVIAASTGSVFLRVDGGAGTSFYVKETGTTTNTGWVGK